MSAFRIMTSLLLAYLLTACAGIAGTGQGKEMAGYANPVNIIDTQTLYQMDRTIVQDPAVIQYVENIRVKLETAVGQDCDCVVLVDSFGGYEAYSLSHKTIVISAGVLAQADSEDEVAALIAHEMGHTYKKDTIKAFAQNAALYTLKAGGMALGAGHYTLMFGEFVDDATRGLIYHQWNAEQEIEADLFALQLIAKANYATEGLAMALRRLEEYSSQAVASAPAATQAACQQQTGNKMTFNLQACSKQLTGADQSVYQDGAERLKSMMQASSQLTPEQRRRRSQGAVPRFASIDYLFNMNTLVSDNPTQLKRALANIERRPLPASLQGNVAVSNKLASAYLLVGNSTRAAHYMELSLSSKPRTAWAFNQLYKYVDHRGDPALVERAMREAHEEIGLMPALLPIEAYLAERHKLMIATLFNTGRCLMTIIDDHKTLNLCDQFSKQAKSGQPLNW